MNFDVSKFTYEIFKPNEEKRGWRLADGTKNEIVIQSADLFDKDKIVVQIKEIRANISVASILFSDKSSNESSKFLMKFYKNDEDNEWYWTLLHNGKPITKDGKILVDAQDNDIESSIEDYLKNIREVMAKADYKWVDEPDPAKVEKDKDNTPPKGLPGSWTQNN